MERGIDWYDPKDQDDNAQRVYYNEAQSILKNDVFNNELNHYIAEMVNYIAMETKDFDQVMHVRSAIVALESFRARLEKIAKPNKSKTVEEPYSPL